MNLVNIEIFENGSTKTETEIIGQIGEGNVTRLKFKVPPSYRGYYKYLDILKGNGEKTQTVVGDTDSEIFYYTIPYSLTGFSELFIQLVLKKESSIFKSRIIALHFDTSLRATEYLEENFKDTIELLMENKADIKDLKDIESKLLLKATKNELYSLNDTITSKLNEQKNLCDIRLEALEVVSECLREKKVDKIYGKGLSSNDYTNEDKQKLANLPSEENLDKLLSERVPIIINEGDISYDDIKEAGIYCFLVYDGDICYNDRLLVEHEFELISQYLFRSSGGVSQRTYNTFDDQWTSWKTIDNIFTDGQREKLSSLPSSDELFDRLEALAIKDGDLEYYIGILQNDLDDLRIAVGDIDILLDELHSYAQALISGGEA